MCRYAITQNDDVFIVYDSKKTVNFPKNFRYNIMRTSMKIPMDPELK